MASKSFTSNSEPRRPRAVTNDAAYVAARAVFERTTPIPEGYAAPDAPPTPTLPMTAQPISAVPPPNLPRQPEKMSVYPTAADRQRLSRIKTAFRVGESFVVEYALERLFATKTDDEIAAELHRRGYSLRRAR